MLLGALCLTTAMLAPAALTVEAVGTCPSSAAVEAALLPLVATASIAELNARITIRDLGAGYEVEAKDVARRVTDADRRCEERAQAAAVIAMLAIAPPRVPDLGSRSGKAVPPLDASRSRPDEAPEDPK